MQRTIVSCTIHIGWDRERKFHRMWMKGSLSNSTFGFIRVSFQTCSPINLLPMGSLYYDNRSRSISFSRQDLGSSFKNERTKSSWNDRSCCEGWRRKCENRTIWQKWSILSNDARFDTQTMDTNRNKLITHIVSCSGRIKTSIGCSKRLPSSRKQQ